MQMKFSEVPIGARFTFLSREYVKTALSVGEDESQIGNLFGYDYNVESDAKEDASNSGMAWERI